ncbi:MAG TPA: NnrU family protein [Candidatus Limnocylindrales bacterium]|nr:NnrU family protein [Candidatus Limnocylindrales bacterium]
MPPWAWILVWAFLFGVTHMAIASVRLRPMLVGRLGEGPYLGLYSLVAAATFVPMVSVYLAHIHDGPLLWSLRGSAPIHWLSMLFSGAMFSMVIAALVQPSPASLGPRKHVRAYGLTRITRHPLFMSLGLWALGHLLVNGFAADVAFFGSVFLIGLVGCMHQDARKRVTERGTLDAFFAETSLLPFVAIAQGRTRFVPSEMPWIALAVGVVVSTILYQLHDWLFR